MTGNMTAANKIVLLKTEPEPDKGLIKTLSGLLRAAKEGRLTSASIVFETLDSVHWIITGNDINNAEHVLGLEQLKYDLMFRED